MLRAYKLFWVKAFDFKGTSSIGDLLWVAVVEMLLGFLLPMFLLESAVVAIFIYSLVAFIPHLSLLVRRLNGADKTWKTLLWMCCMMPLLRH